MIMESREELAGRIYSIASMSFLIVGRDGVPWFLSHNVPVTAFDPSWNE
jgi:hypothetical protein